MGRNKGAAVESGEMLPFDDAEADFDATSKLMTNRSRFEAFAMAERARLAEALLTLPFRQMLEAAGVKGDVAVIEDKFQEFLETALDGVANGHADGTCYICHMPFDGEDAKFEQHETWVVEGKKVYGEPTGESAHGRCVKRLREGGDAGEKPLF